MWLALPFPGLTFGGGQGCEAGVKSLSQPASEGGCFWVTADLMIRAAEGNCPSAVLCGIARGLPDFLCNAAAAARDAGGEAVVRQAGDSLLGFASCCYRRR